MEVKWIGTPNFATGRKGYKPLAIINHIMEGTLAGTDDWFSKPESQVSSHYGIGRNGEVHQYVKEEDTAWANGRKLEPNEAWIANFPVDVNPNLWTISIEHEGYPDQPLTPEQTAATIELQRYLTAKWNIPVDDVHITGHFRIDSQWKSDCPGPHFPWDAIYAALKPVPAPAATVDKVPYDSNQFKYLAGLAKGTGGESQWAIGELAKMMYNVTGGATVSCGDKITQAVNIGNRVFVPVADILDLIGVGYAWDDANKNVKVVK
jgi:hypothetical protein